MKEIEQQLNETTQIVRQRGTDKDIEHGVAEVVDCISYAIQCLDEAKRKEIPIVGHCYVQLIEDLLEECATLCLMMARRPEYRVLHDSFVHTVKVFMKFIKYNRPIVLVTWAIDPNIEH